MTGREIVRATLYFEDPPRYAYSFPDEYGSDFYGSGMDPSPDARRSNGTDEWGCRWASLANTFLGEVYDHPLKSWDDLSSLAIPDFMREDRWERMKYARAEAGGRYLTADVCSMYERLHFLRGLENLLCDVVLERERLTQLLNLIADYNVAAIERYAAYGVDAIFFCDDWGLQDRLMIDPEAWREIWKPAYKKAFGAAHAYGMDCFLHSCGYITDILDDLIEIGLNAIHMDQQENMGLAALGERFAGRLTFYSCVDIQQTMARGSAEDVRAYAREMGRLLGTKKGGFIPRWYTDPAGAGHSRENIDAMCDEFLKMSAERENARR